MTHFISSPEKFADLFNAKVLGAYRKVNVDDIREMTTCGLIHRYDCYDTINDLQTVIGILNYEQLREKRTHQEEMELIGNLPLCRLCGKPLPEQPEDKKGRRKEYCNACQSSRSTMRGRKWRRKMKADRN